MPGSSTAWTSTSAAAAVIYATSALRDPPPQVILDRPFVYLLIDCETLLPLFIGTVDRIA